MTAAAPNGRRRRVVWVGGFPPKDSTIIGGLTTSCRLLVESSFGRRVDLTLVDSTQPNNPAPPLVKRVGLAMRRLATFVTRFERVRPDAVLVFASSTQLSVAEKGLMAWYARLRGAASLMFPRGGAVFEAARRSRRTARRLRHMFRGAHVVLCQGPAWREFAVETLGHPSEATFVIPNWTATPAHVALAARRHRRPASPVRFVFVGWINREKGTFELIEACRRLAALDFTMTLVGDGVAAEEIRALVGSYGLDQRVRMTGWLTGDDLLRAYAEADAFVLPSWAEGLPNAMIEAMASGLAPIVTRVGAIPGFVEDEVQGLLIEPRDVDGLARAMERLITDDTLRHRLGEAAAASAAREFSVEQAAERMIRAIESAIVLARGASAREVVVGEHA